MFKNHLKIALRNIKKEKLFTSIKIGGFAVGIAACVLIALFIRDELSYDEHYSKKDRLFRVVMNFNIDGEILKNVHFPLPFAETLQADFPEIKKAGKVNTSELFGAGKRGLRPSAEIQNHFEEGFVFADQTLFEILEIPLESGNLKEALKKPQSLVLSEDKASKYFPNGNALGQTVILDDNNAKPYTITGVMKDIPNNSHLNFDFLLPIEDSNMSWTSQNYFTYVLVDEKANVSELENKLFSVMEDYVLPAQRERGRDAGFMNILENVNYALQPITDIHLKSDITMQDGLNHGDIRFVWLFAAIAGFILLLAAINFINLSTAKSTNRAKEVGLRKTVGAFKRNLVVQFLTESVIYSFFSFVIGVLLAWILLPYFNSIAAKSITIPWGAWWFVPVLLAAASIIGLVAGLYPAFYLSAFRPVNVLSGSLRVGNKSGRLRSGLVVFQFATSVILIIGTIIIYKQMDYILKKELGYEKERVIILDGGGMLGNKADSFKAQLLASPRIKQVTMSDFLPIEGSNRNQNTFKKVGRGSEDRGISGQFWTVDYDYLETLGIHIQKGRNFSREFASDSINSIIINSKMAEELGYEDPIGKTINNNPRDWIIIGVIEDFHFKSLKEGITPLTLALANNSANTISIKLSEGNLHESLTSIAAIWNKNVPNQTFNYTFLDQQFARMHKDVQRMGKIFNSFALVAIFVACLGLFALSAYMAEQRRKEISIRMVLGASFRDIYNILSINFLKLVGIAILIAIPIAWYMMNRWLEDFAYRINISWEVFAAAGAIALVIAFLTISYQSVGSALIQPLKSLRSE